MDKGEKGFLERLAGAIPGVKGYREKEGRRDTDKRLRDYLAAELDRQRKALDGWKRARLAEGKLDRLDDADRLGGKIARCADQLRFASYGYAGFFDQVKVREEELDQLYAYDGELLVQVRELEPRVQALAAGGDDALAEADRAVDALAARIEGRRQLLQRPD